LALCLDLLACGVKQGPLLLREHTCFILAAQRKILGQRCGTRTARGWPSESLHARERLGSQLSSRSGSPSRPSDSESRFDISDDSEPMVVDHGLDDALPLDCTRSCFASLLDWRSLFDCSPRGCTTPRLHTIKITVLFTANGFSVIENIFLLGYS
jgi:hypothetical protein